MIIWRTYFLNTVKVTRRSHFLRHFRRMFDKHCESFAGGPSGAPFCLVLVIT